MIGNYHYQRAYYMPPIEEQFGGDNSRLTHMSGGGSVTVTEIPISPAMADAIQQFLDDLETRVIPNDDAKIIRRPLRHNPITE